MVALFWGEAMDTERAADFSFVAAFGLGTAGLNRGIEVVTLGCTTVLALPEFAAGGMALKVTTSFSSTDL